MGLTYSNSSRTYLQRYIADFAADTQAHMLVLDAGAGDAPYKGLFAHAHYETADLQTVDKSYAETTYKCDLRSIPVADGRFDRILFNQVMEHVPDPLAVLHELARVLKPGGLIFCSAPLLFEEHEQPFDFYRYTQFGHRHLFTAAGLDIESLFPLEGYFGMLGYQLWRGYKRLPLWHPAMARLPWSVVLVPFFLLLKLVMGAGSGVLSRLDKVIKIEDRSDPLNYVVIARKPLDQARAAD